MKGRNGAFARAAMLAVCLLAAAATTALAQGRGGPPPGGGMGGGMGGPGGMGSPGGMGGAGNPGSMGGSTPGNRPSGDIGPSPSGGRGNSPEGQVHGLQLGPPRERWWDDKSFVKTLKLRPEQQTRMDAIFDQNKAALLSRLQGLQQAESQMNELTRSPNLDESTLFAQIDRVAEARADLEKANTHMLLQLRKEMDPDQISRLEKQR